VVVTFPRNVIDETVEPEMGISGDTQRFKSIRNDQVTARHFNCRDVSGSSELVPHAEDDDLRFVSVQLQAVVQEPQPYS